MVQNNFCVTSCSIIYNNCNFLQHCTLRIFYKTVFWECTAMKGWALMVKQKGHATCVFLGHHGILQGHVGFLLSVPSVMSSLAQILSTTNVLKTSQDMMLLVLLHLSIYCTYMLELASSFKFPHDMSSKQTSRCMQWMIQESKCFDA